LIFNIDKEELYQQTYSLQSIGVHGIRLGKKQLTKHKYKQLGTNVYLFKV